MKTPMQELLEIVKEYRDSETSPLVISRLNSICVDIIGMLEKEKQEFINCYIRAMTKEYLNPLPRKYYYEIAEEYYYTFINPLGKNEKNYK